MLHTSTFDIYWFGQQNMHGLTNASIARMEPDMSLLNTLPDSPLSLSRGSSPASSVVGSEIVSLHPQSEADKSEGSQVTLDTPNTSEPEDNTITDTLENGDPAEIMAPTKSLDTDALDPEPADYTGRVTRNRTRGPSKTPQPQLQISNITNDNNGLFTPHPTDDGEEVWGKETIPEGQDVSESGTGTVIGTGTESDPPIDPSLMETAPPGHAQHGGKTVAPPTTTKKRGGGVTKGRGGKSKRAAPKKQVRFLLPVN